MRVIFSFLGGILDTIVNFIIAALLDLFQFLIDWIFRRKPKPPEPKPYQASFGSRKNLLSKRHHGFRLTGKESISAAHSHQNSIIIGGTGTGKSSVVLIPSLLSMHGSFVVHDPSGELYDKTKTGLLERGYEIKRLHFGDPQLSIGFNPLARVTSGAEVNKVAALIIRTSLGKDGDPFWDLQATNLLQLAIHLVKATKEYPATLGGVRSLVAKLAHEPKEIEQLVHIIGKADLLQEYQAFQAFDDKVRLGVVATVMSALQIFSDEQVVAVTSRDDCDFTALRTTKTALFIQTPIADQAYYSVLSALFLEQLFATLLQDLPAYGTFDVYCLIDEASSLYIPSLSVVIANVRKYRVGILLALQDFNQLVERYGQFDAETIRSNCFSKLYFTGQSLQTARELEEILGRYEYPDEKGRSIIRPLLTSDEIRMLPKNQALLLLGYFRPLLVDLKPYYKQGRLQRLTSGS